MNCNPQFLAGQASCWARCLSRGQIRAVQNYLWCQISNTSKFGGGGSTPPTLPTPTGFSVNSNISGTVLTAAWDNAPGGVTGTEIWTSTDGTNYALDTTVPAGFNTHFYGAIAVGSFQYFKIRFTNGAGLFSSFTTPIEWSGQAMDWAARVLTNSGDLDNVSRILFVNNLWCTLVNGGVSSQILCLNPLAAVFSAGLRSLNADATPLIKGAGSDPWTTQGFANTSCTVNGIACGVGNFMNTGFSLTSFASDNSIGMVVYDFTGTSEAVLYAAGVSNAANSALALSVNGGGTTTAYDISLTNTVSTASPGAGLYGLQRVAATDFRLYFGNSTNVPAQIGATQAGANGTRFNQNIFFGCLNNNGAQALMTAHVLSFWCVTNGLSLAQFTTLFNAVQSYRVAMGGGFV